SEGKDLIRFFSIPCRPTKTNGGRTRNLKEHDPNKWDSFKAYNKRDVETEIAIQDKLSKFPMPEAEWDNYLLDQLINDRGIKLDLEIVAQAIKCDDLIRNQLVSRMKEITKLENPNSVKQMREWLQTKGVETDSLNKAAVTHLIETTEGEIKEVIQMRKQLQKPRVKKYAPWEKGVCGVERAWGSMEFKGRSVRGGLTGG